MKVKPGAERRRRLLRGVGERMAPDQRAERGDRHHAVDEGGHHRRRHVQIHDLGGLALLVVGRRQEGERQSDGEQEPPSPTASHGNDAARQVHEDSRIGEIEHASGF